MASLNKWMGIGNLGADPEFNVTPGGKSACQFRMACTEKWKDKDGQPKERTEWVRVQVWDGLADVCSKHLAKGKQVYVEGRMQTREWQDKDGNRRWTTEIVSDKVVFLGSPSGSRDVAEAPPANDTSPANPSSAGGDIFPPYGRSKGAPVSGATMQDLEYYAAGARRSLADPAKAKWHDNERALLAAIEAEIARHGLGAPPPVSQPSGDEDDIPF